MAVASGCIIDNMDKSKGNKMTSPKCEMDATGSISTTRSCQTWFSQLEGAVRELSKQIESLATDVKELSKQVILQGQSLNSSWVTIKEDLTPNIRKVPEEIDEAVQGHESSCPARKRAMRLAEGQSIIPESVPKESKFSIPKILIYSAIAIGVTIGAAIIAVIYLKQYLPS